MLISFLVSVMFYQYGSDLVMVYAKESFLLYYIQGVLVNVIINQNNNKLTLYTL